MPGLQGGCYADAEIYQNHRGRHGTCALNMSDVNKNSICCSPCPLLAYVDSIGALDPAVMPSSSCSRSPTLSPPFLVWSFGACMQFKGEMGL